MQNSAHLVVLSRRVLHDLHGGRQRRVRLLVLLLLAAALHAGGRLGEEVPVLAEDPLRDTRRVGGVSASDVSRS